MSLVVVNRGEVDMLDLIVAQDYTLHLFKNDPTAGLSPDQIDALDETDFTEATFAGYAAIALPGGGATWSTVTGNPSTATGSLKTFTRTSTGTPETIQGYYVTADFDANALVWFELFDGPVVVEFLNDAIEITPRITLDDREGNEVETGTIAATGRATAPTGWLLCDGSAVSRTTFAALFAAIGTAYGAGNGSTTFNVPALCGATARFPLGKATAGTGSTLGATGGAIDHVHGLDTSSSGARISAETSADIIYAQRKTVAVYTDTFVSDAGTVAFSNNASSRTLATPLTGNSDTNNPPYQTVNYIVKT